LGKKFNINTQQVTDMHFLSKVAWPEGICTNHFEAGIHYAGKIVFITIVKVVDIV
jgi:hypothetical protein